MQKQRVAVLSLASMMAFRMLGLFMLLPVLSLYVTSLPGATPSLLGLTLGIYGLTQAGFQIPLGLLSDKFGRKKIITFGLILFALGSVVAALAHGIYGILIGRALQGAGAIGSTVLALAADLTHDEDRTKAMALIGMTIGLAFLIAMLLGPLLNHYFHLSGIFWATFLFALCSLVLLHTVVPNPAKILHHTQTDTAATVLKNPNLWRLNISIFMQHAILTSLFIPLPILLHAQFSSMLEQTAFYCVILIIAVILMVPVLIMAEKKRRLKLFFLSTIFVLLLTQGLMGLQPSGLILLGSLLALFFAAFTWLEAVLPSWISKIAPIRAKGTAMGVYSTCQFLGIFCGGVLGGWIFGHYHATGVFYLNMLLGLIWLLVCLAIREPAYLSTFTFGLTPDAAQNSAALLTKLQASPGIAEVALLTEDNALIIKADKKLTNTDQLRNLIGAGNLR